MLQGRGLPVGDMSSELAAGVGRRAGAVASVSISCGCPSWYLSILVNLQISSSMLSIEFKCELVFQIL